MIGKTCGVRMYKGPCDCKIACERCRIGCYRPARHRNPFFGRHFGDVDKDWWRCGTYSYAEYLCAECYDLMASSLKEDEDMFREEEGFEEDPEFTRILKTL